MDGHAFNESYERIASAFGAHIVHVSCLQKPSRAARWHAWCGDADDQIANEYITYYHKLNPRTASILTGERISSDARFLDIEAFRKTEFYDWNYRIANVGDMMWMQCHDSDDAVYAVALGRPRDSTGFGAQEYALAEALLPHMEANFMLSRLLRLDMPFFEAACAYVETADRALVLLNSRLIIVRISEALATINRGAIVTLRKSARLNFGPDQSRFEKACKIATETGTPQTMRFDSRRRLSSISIAPITVRSMLCERAFYLVDVSCADAADAQEFISRLTRAEQNILDQLIAGRSLQQIANARGTSYNTCRNQMASIHAKPGTRSIPQLLSRFARPGNSLKVLEK